jgi:ABC-2 type transport system permease protein
MMRPLAVCTRIELALFLREPAAVFFTVALPVLLLLLFGSADPPAQLQAAGLTLADMLVPGLIVMVMLTSGLMALPETLASYRERGVLRRMHASPLRSWQVLGSHAGAHGLVNLAGLVLLVGLAVFFGARPAGGVGILALVVALLAAAAVVLSVGFLIASVAPTGRTAQAIAAALYFPAVFVSGAAIATEALPEVVRKIGDWVPFSYAVDAIRSAWIDGQFNWTALAVVAATAAVAAVAASRLFRWS